MHRGLKFPVRSEIKKVEVPAPVVDVEELLVQAFAVHIRGFTGAAANHLPELDFGLDLLEEHQVQDIRYIYAGVHHIHGNYNLRHLTSHGETVNQILRLGNLIVNEYTKIAAIFRILVLKTFDNLDSVLVIARKDNRLAYRVTAIDRKPCRHQVFENPVNGVLIINIICDF